MNFKWSTGLSYNFSRFVINNSWKWMAWENEILRDVGRVQVFFSTCPPFRVCFERSDTKLQGDRGCLMWSGDLIDIRKHLDDMRGQDIRNGEEALELGLEKKIQNAILVVSAISGMIILGLIICLIWKKTDKRALSTGQESRKENVDVPLFDLSTIATATNDFSSENLIVAVGTSHVYKA